MTVQEQNKMIAEFMGAKIIDAVGYNFAVYRFENMNPGDCYLQQMKYHSDWNWLMQVTEKIESLGFKFQICRKRVQILEDGGSQLHVLTVKETTKKESAYKAVVDFIEWHNA